MDSVVENFKGSFRWVVVEGANVRMSKNSYYIIFNIDRKLFSLKIEDLFDLISGFNPEMDLKRLDVP